MRKQIFKGIMSLVLLLNVLLSPIGVTAVERETDTIDPQVSLSVDDKLDTTVDKETKQINLTIDYTPIDLIDFENLVDHSTEREKDSLKLELPAGVTYSASENEALLDNVTQEESVIWLDMAEMPTQQNMILDINWKQLAETSIIQATHYVNDVALGITEEVQITKKITTEDASIVEESAIVSSTDNTEEKVKENAKSESKKVLSADSLDLETPTTRSLPVPTITDGQYDNVSCFEVGSVDEWNEAFSVGKGSYDPTNNNNLNEITYINITDSFKMSEDTGGTVGGVLKLIHTNRIDKKVVIDGNGETIDFRNVAFSFSTNDWDIVFQDVHVFNGNDWGSFDLYNSGRKNTLTLHDYIQNGAQAFEGANGRIILSGMTSLTSSPTETYFSPIDNKEITIDQRFNLPAARGSANIAVGEVYIKSGSNISMDNGRYGANAVVYLGGNFYIEDSSVKTNVTFSNLKQPKNPDGWLVNDFAPSSISIVLDVAASIWPDAYRPSTLQGRSNSIYFGDNAEVSIHNGAPRRKNAGVMQIEPPTGTRSIELGENAMFNGIIDENTAVRGQDKTPVFFSAGTMGSILLNKNASFDLKVGDNNPATSKDEVIQFAGQGQIKLDEGSLFKVRSASDTNAGLIKMEGAGSGITIANQAVFDIGFSRLVAANLISLNGAIKIPSSGNYVHRIRHWNAGNSDEDNPDGNFQPLDNTTINYTNTTVSSKSTNLAAGFVDNGTVSLFNNNYKSNAQRLLVDPIVFNVKTIDELTNETKSAYTVKGTAELPGGSIILSGGPFDAMNEADRTVTVQADGSYEWTGSLSRPFYWGETIRASYVGHADKFSETTVKDVTKPTGIGREIHVIEGAALPTAKDYIISVEDTNALETNKDNFTYSINGDPLASLIDTTITNGQSMQEHDGNIVIKDASGNASELIPVKLIVHRADTIDTILANNLTVCLSDVAGFTANMPQYEAYLRTQMEASAATIENGNLVDLTDDISIDNLSEVKNEVGVYTVKFVIPSKGLEKVVQLKVISNLTEPRDPSTENPSPADKENEGTGEFGELRLDYVPSTFDFGTQVTQWKDAEYAAIGNSDQWVQVADQRPDVNQGWSLKATATDFIADSDTLAGAKLVLPQGDMYNKKTASSTNPAGLVSSGNVQLTSTAATVFTGIGENSKDESTYVWKKNQVKLQVPKGQGKAGKTYHFTITWTIVAGIQ